MITARMMMIAAGHEAGELIDEPDDIDAFRGDPALKIAYGRR